MRGGTAGIVCLINVRGGVLLSKSVPLLEMQTMTALSTLNMGVLTRASLIPGVIGLGVASPLSPK